MRDRELNLRISKDIFGYNINKKNGQLFENHPLGDRPIRDYVSSIEWAWEVADRMKIALIPVSEGNWFAFVGTTEKGWQSPAEMFQFLASNSFANAAAALDASPARAICMAALHAFDKNKAAAAAATELSLTNSMSH